jgi:hypothetical protein
MICPAPTMISRWKESPSLNANATKTVALVPSALASAFAYRHDFEGFEGVKLSAMAIVSVIGDLEFFSPFANDAGRGTRAQGHGGRKKSPGHNANLLQKRAQEIGIGAAGWKLDGGQEIFRVVQAFASACPQKRQSNPWIVKTLAGTVDTSR